MAVGDFDGGAFNQIAVTWQDADGRFHVTFLAYPATPTGGRALRVLGDPSGITLFPDEKTTNSLASGYDQTTAGDFEGIGRDDLAIAYAAAYPGQTRLNGHLGVVSLTRQLTVRGQTTHEIDSSALMDTEQDSGTWTPHGIRLVAGLFRYDPSRGYDLRHRDTRASGRHRAGRHTSQRGLLCHAPFGRVAAMDGPGGTPDFTDRLSLTQRASSYAEEMHAGQTRSDGSPFILHPLEVAALLSEAGASDQLVAAGVLHDLIEKTDVTASDLQERFGAAITALVVSVSDDDRIGGYARRKAALRQQVADAGDDALVLFAADKLSKLRELRRAASEQSTDQTAPTRSPDPRARRLRHYQRSLALLEEQLPQSPLVGRLRDELRSFLRERALLTPGG